MRYALIKNNKVVQIDCNQREGFIEVEDSVVCGMLHDGEHFSLPLPEPPTIQQQIDALEAQQTPRLLRECIDGHSESLTMLTDIDNAINELRAKL